MDSLGPSLFDPMPVVLGFGWWGSVWGLSRWVLHWVAGDVAWVGAVRVVLYVSFLGGLISCCSSPGCLWNLLSFVVFILPVSGGCPRSDGLSTLWGQAPALASLCNCSCAWSSSSLVVLVPAVVASCSHCHVWEGGPVVLYLIHWAS